MRIWFEPYDSSRHGNPMGGAVGDPRSLVEHHRAPTLNPHSVTFVAVAGFTFEFHSFEQLRACLDYYRRPHHHSRRSAAAADAVERGEVAWRLEVERWYERLPLYLREEPKRLQVVAALEEALRRLTS